MARPTSSPRGVETAELHITHVDKEKHLIKLYAQIGKNALGIERLLYQLRDLLESNHDLRPKVSSDIKVGLLCCVKYVIDGQYYRAKILSPMSNMKVTVCFIDFGNRAEVNVSDIRLYSSLIKTVKDELVQKYLELPSLGLEFYLAGVAARKEWDDQIIESLKNKLSNTEMSCTICDVGDKKVILEIHTAEIDFVAQLLNSNAGFKIPLDTFINIISNNEVKPSKVSFPDVRNIPPPTAVDVTRQPPPATMPNLTQPPPLRLVQNARISQPFTTHPGNIPGVQVRRSEVLSAPPVQSLQFATEMLAIGVTHTVFVSYVEDGPHAFSIQLKNEVQSILVKLMTDIANHNKQPINPGTIIPGSICLGPIHNGDVLCRAIVMNVMDDKVTLYFADFGHSEVVSHSDIYQIPPQFVTPKVISHRFTLANIKDVQYTDEQKQLFKKLVAHNESLQIKVTPPEANPLKQYCDLYINCKNIKAIMQEMAQSILPLRYVPHPLPKRGSHVRVFVSFVLNPSRFFVQLEEGQSVLKEIMNKVEEHCINASPIPLCNLRAGEPCCALYEDGTWYRADIRKVNHETAIVNFVDYGNEEEVEHINMRMITPELVTKTKAQALACSLKRYESRFNVSEEISNRLEELILEKSLTMHVVGYTETNGLITELSDNGQDIGTLLDATPVHKTSAATSAAPKAATSNDWEEKPQASSATNDWEESKFSNARGPRFNKVNKGERQDWKQAANKRYRDDGSKSWRSQDGNTSSRYNRGERRNDGPPFEKRYNKEETEDKPWSRGENRFNRDDGNKFGGERRGRFGDEDKGGKFGDSESRGGRFNSTGEDKPWKKRDEGGSWKDRGDNSSSWRDKEGGGWKGRDAGGDRRNKYDGDSDFKGGYNRGSGDRSNSHFRGGDNSYNKPAIKAPKPDTFDGIPYPIAKVGMVENSQVVFTTSPTDFYVQLNSSAEDLNQLMEKIATACESGVATNMPSVEEKKACLAQYSVDESWYRGFVEENEFDSAKVYFVDYGNLETVEHSKIKTLPEDMNSLPAQAVKCRLYGVPETAQLDAFLNLTDEKTLHTQFVARHFLTKSFQVVLLDEESGTNINVAMGAEEEEIVGAMAKIGSTIPSMPRYPSGTSLTVQMTWYQSPSLFYLQPMDSHPEFRAMMQSMQSLVKTGVVRQNDQLNVGDFVIARFKTDKVLYRALVTEAGFSPSVQYVDYGNKECVESGSVWNMEQEYATLPIQAFACSLAGVLPIGDAWPQANLEEHFEADTLECCVVKEGEGDSQYVVKLVKNGEEVAAKIIEAGLAAPDSAGAVSSELDTSLLVGQIMSVTLLRVEEDYTFLAQPPALDPELQSLETVVGEGIKCKISNIKEEHKEQLDQWTQFPAGANINIVVDGVTDDGLQVTVYDVEGQLLPLQESEVPAVDKICALPVLNTRQKVWIAHASDDGIFLHKVVFADHLPELLQKLFDFYNESEEVEQEWKEGELCCGKSVADDQWYRARILESGSDIKVQYIDYGNSEAVPASNLRKLDPTFYVPHAFALKVAFHVSWVVPVETLLELAGETEYNAVVLRSDNGWIAELVDMSGQSLTDKLVELGFATALDNSPFKRVVEGGRFVEGSVMPVSPTFIDSPLQLWVCVGNDIELVEALQDRLQEAAPKLNALKEPSGVFAAKYDDEKWYRAVQLNESEVRFIDYGNSHNADLSDIKELSSDFLELAEGYAVKVELPVGDFKEEATERLNQILLSEETDLEGEIMAHVLSVQETSIIADITKGGTSIVDTLVAENMCTRLQISSGFVSCTNSLQDFYIQEEGCEEPLEVIANIMLTAETFEPISEVEIGNVLAALSDDDGVWYRAEVIEKCENGANVLFVDYGNTSTVTEFRALPSDLSAKPHLSKQCRLHLPSGVAKWSEAALEKFIELSADGATKFGIKFLNNEIPATVSLTYNGKCVSEELKSLCEVVENKTVESETTPIDYSGYDDRVYISYVNSTKDFYIQKEKDEEELNMIKEALSDVSSFEVVDQITDELNEEIIGALFVEDGSWYRAKIIGKVENGTEVLFIDYGNTALATQFVKLPDTLTSKLPYATHCTLGREDWSEEADDHLATLSESDNGSKLFLMKIVKEGSPQTVSLIVDNKVVETELDQLFSLQPKGDIIEESNSSVNNISEEVDTYGDKTTNEVNNVSEEVDTFGDKTTNEISTMPDVDASDNQAVSEMFKTVYLIQVISPDDFFLHTAEATQQIKEIEEKLLEAGSFLQVEDTSVINGQIVAAQFDEDDLWYRAKIINKSESEVKVLFIDLGNTANVAEIKQLPEELLSIPPLAMHCSLKRPENIDWSEKACEAFNKLANDDEATFSLQIVSEGEPNVVDLFINGESVVQQLITVSALAPESPSKQKMEHLDHETHEEQSSEDVGETIKSCTSPEQESLNNHVVEKPTFSLQAVEISYFTGPEDFFVQFLDDKEKFLQMSNDLSDAENFEAMSGEAVLGTDELLAAKLKNDNHWYRAKILDSNTNGTKALFVDFGNIEIATEFRKLPKHLIEKRPLAKHCCLKSPSGSWSEETKKKLSALAATEGQTFELKIVKDGDPCLVDLFENSRSLIETFSAEEVLGDNMQKTILQPVNEEISRKLKNDMTEMTSEFIDKVLDDIEEQENCIQEKTEESLSNDQGHIIEKENEDVQQITKEFQNDMSELLTNEIMVHIKDHEEEQEKCNQEIIEESSKICHFVDKEEKCVQQTTEELFHAKDNTKGNIEKNDFTAQREVDDIDNHLMAVGNETNSFEKDNSEDEVPSEEHNHSQRSNIDDKIVPGCISLVRSDEV